MNLTRTALAATIATTAFWTAKAVAIGIAGGLGRSPLENPLYLVGLACCAVAATTTGISLSRPTFLSGLVGAVLGFVLVGVLAVGVGAVVTAVQPAHPGWAWTEVNLWAIFLALLAVNLRPRDRRAAPSAWPRPGAGDRRLSRPRGRHRPPIASGK